MFAYSTKKLRANYAGSALRVVRPSDSATLNIGFVGQNLDAAAIDTFLGSEVGQVDIWYDQSGNGNHSTQTTAVSRPLTSQRTIGGARSIVFPQKFMAIPAGSVISRQACDVYSVVDLFNSNAQDSFYQLGAASNQLTVLQAVTTNGVGYFLVNGGQFGEPTFKPQSRPCIYYVRQSATEAIFAQGNEQKTAGAAADVSMVGGFIGNTGLSGGFEALSFHSCHVAYGRTLSSGEATAMRGALESLFGTVVGTPTRRVIFKGDSITAASAPTSLYFDGYAKQATSLLSQPCAVYNVSGGGQQIQNEVGFYAAQTGLLLGQYPTDSRVVLLFLGTNDLTIGGRTAAQIYADIQTYAGLVRGSGGKVIVSTILPNVGWDGTQQTTRTDLNTLVRTNWASFADGLADFGADATMGPQAAAANTALYPDGLHPSRLGHSYLAPIAAAAINALL